MPIWNSTGNVSCAVGYTSLKLRSITYLGDINRK